MDLVKKEEGKSKNRVTHRASIWGRRLPGSARARGEFSHNTPEKGEMKF